MNETILCRSSLVDRPVGKLCVWVVDPRLLAQAKGTFEFVPIGEIIEINFVGVITDVVFEGRQGTLPLPRPACVGENQYQPSTRLDDSQPLLEVPIVSGMCSKQWLERR